MERYTLRQSNKTHNFLITKAPLVSNKIRSSKNNNIKALITFKNCFLSDEINANICKLTKMTSSAVSDTVFNNDGNRLEMDLLISFESLTWSIFIHLIAATLVVTCSDDNSADREKGTAMDGERERERAAEKEIESDKDRARKRERKRERNKRARVEGKKGI